MTGGAEQDSPTFFGSWRQGFTSLGPRFGFPSRFGMARVGTWCRGFGCFSISGPGFVLCYPGWNLPFATLASSSLPPHLLLGLVRTRKAEKSGGEKRQTPSVQEQTMLWWWGLARRLYICNSPKDTSIYVRSGCEGNTGVGFSRRRWQIGVHGRQRLVWLMFFFEASY